VYIFPSRFAFICIHFETRTSSAVSYLCHLQCAAEKGMINLGSGVIEKQCTCNMSSGSNENDDRTS